VRISSGFRADDVVEVVTTRWSVVGIGFSNSVSVRQVGDPSWSKGWAHAASWWLARCERYSVSTSRNCC